MAAAAGPFGAPAPASVKWDPSQYAFDPYALTAEKLVPEFEEKPAAGGDGGKAGAPPAAPALPVKRRPGRQKRTSVLCQVPGCEEELVEAKKYYRRYRICQAHCNMACMMIEGRRQRFCQQCGRFHDIAEFEGAKRSCKRKLKRHNERRRSAAGGGAGKKAGGAAWKSDSEEDEADAEAFGDSSGSEAPRRRPARRAKPSAAAAAAAATAAADGSAASGSTGQPPSGALAGAASLAAQAAPGAATPPQRSPAHASVLGPAARPSHSGSMDSSSHPAAPAGLAYPPRGGLAAHQAQLAPPPALGTLGSMPTLGSDSLAAHHLSLGASCSVQRRSAGPGTGAAPGGEPDLDAVLQELLADEELKGLPLDPLEMFLAGGEPAQAPAPAPPAPPPQPPAPPPQQPLEWQQGQQYGPALEDLPMELLADFPLVPLPYELAAQRQLSAAGRAHSGHSSGTAGGAATPSHSGGGSGTVAGMQPGAPYGGPAAAGQLLTARPLAPPPVLLPAALPGVGSAVLAGAAGMLRPSPFAPAGYGAGGAPPQQHVAALQQAQLQALQAQAAAQAAVAQAAAMQRVLAAHGMAAPPLVPPHPLPHQPLVGYPAAQPDRLTSMSLKVFNCTPDQLLPSVRAELEALLRVGQGLLEGYIRPGCTQLTVNALLQRDRADELAAAGLGGVVGELLAAAGGRAPLDGDLTLQYDGELAVVKRRRVVALLSLRHSPALVPALAPLLPLAVACPPPAAGASSSGGGGLAPMAAPLLLRGRHLCGDADLILARQQGANLTVELHGCGEARGGEWARVRVLGLLPGWADVEAQHGSFLSAPRALLVLPSAAAAAEVRQLERGAAGVEDVDAFLRDTGLVVQYLCRADLAAEGQSVPPYTPGLLASIAARARRLAAAGAARGWAAFVELLLPATTADGASPAEAVAAMDAACPPGASLLHVAAGTGCAPLVRALAAWGAAAGYSWPVDARGTTGVTPLHVAALLADGGAMRAALTACAPATRKLWGLVQADDGTTPEGLAEAVAAAAGGSAATAAAAPPAAAAPRPATSAASSGSVVARPGGAACTAAKASSSKAASTSACGGLAGDELGEVSSGVAALASKASSKLSADAADGLDGAWRCSARRRSRAALKAHLDDLHMTSILSEVETALPPAARRHPALLADALSGAAAAGAAMLRALRPRSAA